jgi:hypothetical protein
LHVAAHSSRGSLGFGDRAYVSLRLRAVLQTWMILSYLGAAARYLFGAFPCVAVPSAVGYPGRSNCRPIDAAGDNPGLIHSGMTLVGGFGRRSWRRIAAKGAKFPKQWVTKIGPRLWISQDGRPRKGFAHAGCVGHIVVCLAGSAMLSPVRRLKPGNLLNRHGCARHPWPCKGLRRRI